MTVPNSFTYPLSPEQQDLLIEVLARGNYVPVTLEHTRIAAQTPDCKIALYNSGKCLIQGKGAADFITFVLEPVVLKRAGLGYEDILNPEASEPRMGVDESGKGDFFGPLVVAAAYADAALVARMREMNVRDSKLISSDKVALALGSDLRKLLGRQFSIVKIGPEAYNRLYAKMRNVNSILAWAHARAIENLLETVPGCPKAISDQFGAKSQVEKALMQKGRKIVLVQRHKAESDIAVAAASIIAREMFLRALKQMGTDSETIFPKGASEAVVEAAELAVKKHGAQILLKIAKCHFKTADTVLEKAGKARSDLGPDGQARSQAKKLRYAAKHRPDAE